MTEVKNDSDPTLEGVTDHRSFHRRVWIIQRAAWLAFGLILLACLLGITGKGGYFSRASIETPAGTVDYPFLSRWNAPDVVRVRFQPSGNDQAFVIDAAFLDAFSIEGIDPPPRLVEPKDGLIRYVFPADRQQPTQVSFRLHTQSPGIHHLHLGVGDTVLQPLFIILP
jgi:hypothetical protein